METKKFSELVKNAQVGFYRISKAYPQIHNHEYWEFHIVTEGKIRHHINGKDYTMEKLDSCLIRPKDEHCVYKIDNQPMELLNIIMNDKIIHVLCSAIGESFYDKIIGMKNELNVKLDNAVYYKINDYLLFLLFLNATATFNVYLKLKCQYLYR